MPQIATAKPNLRIFRKIDLDRASEALVEHLEKVEGASEYVDNDLARDWEWSSELMEITVGLALVDEQGSILAEFDGEDALARAEAARGSAKITFSLDFDKPKKTRAAKEPVETAVDTAADAGVPAQ